jgi:Ni/Fe-hydrogenase 1 B-type cytochrome subunit
MSVEAHVEDQTAAGSTVYVYEAPVRIWHWVNALCFAILAITGYFIASPLPSLSGEASDHYLMGYIRFAHFAAAYVFAIAFLGRAYWALVGNHHAQQLFKVPVTDPHFWRGLLLEMRWYMFLEKKPQKHLGHNPLAHVCMFIAITIGGIFMIVTGFALYGEGTLEGSWAHAVFTSWVIPLFGQSQDVHTWHHMVSWMMVWFTIVHIYASLREDIMSRQTLISAIVSGSRTFRD